MSTRPGVAAGAASGGPGRGGDGGRGGARAARREAGLERALDEARSSRTTPPRSAALAAPPATSPAHAPPSGPALAPAQQSGAPAVAEADLARGEELGRLSRDVSVRLSHLFCFRRVIRARDRSLQSLPPVNADAPPSICTWAPAHDRNAPPTCRCDCATMASFVWTAAMIIITLVPVRRGAEGPQRARREAEAIGPVARRTRAQVPLACVGRGVREGVAGAGGGGSA
jgi:hypothetical protein